MRLLAKIINSGVGIVDEQFFVSKLKAFNYSILIALFSIAIWIGFLLVYEIPLLALPFILFFCLCILCLIFNAKGWLEISRVLFLVFIIATITFTHLVTPELGTIYFFLPFIAITFSIYKSGEWKKSFPFLLIALIIFLYLKFTGYQIATNLALPQFISVYGETISLALSIPATCAIFYLLTYENDKNKYELRTESKNLNSIIENTIDAIWLINQDYDLVTFNKTFGDWGEKSMGVRPRVGDNTIEALKGSKEVEADVKADYDKVFKTGESLNVEKYYEIGDLKVYAELSLNPIFKEGQVKAISCFSKDITGIKQTEERLEKEKNKAEKANNAKSSFLSRMSHELRTPLNAISGATQLMESERSNKDDLDNLGIIQRSTNHLLDRINDILDISNIESGDIKLESANFNLKEVKDSVFNLFYLKASAEGIDLLFNVDENLPETLHGDRNRLLQVINNLVGNALKFTREGYVKVDVQKKQETGEEIVMQVIVEDTGTGIPENQQPNIFENFKQVDEYKNRNFEGIGLGLSIAKTFVTYMGGTISFSSEEGVGSTFYFEIPLYKVHTSEDPYISDNNEADTNYDLTNLYGKNVLMVEDNELNIKVGTKILKRLDTTPFYAKGGEEALDFLMEQKFDLVLLDIHMPGMDGFEVARRIRALENGKTSSSVPIVIMSADVLETAKEKAKESGVDDFLEKPIDISKIGKTINGLL